MSSIALLPASGSGDALLMMIAAHQLKQAGYATTLFHPLLPQLSTWFPHHQICSSWDPPSASLFSLLIVENDNSARVRDLVTCERQRLCLFYPTYKEGKHAPLSPRDQRFDSGLSMAENIRAATERLLFLLSGQPHLCTKENGLVPPSSLVYRALPHRVLLHPTSSSLRKNWLPFRFLKLASLLRRQGLSPVFVVSPGEKSAWEHVTSAQFPLLAPPTLADLATLVYESGWVIGNDSLPGHLASNLGIPSLVIADNPDRLRLWRPDWLPSSLAFPPSSLPRFLRKTLWPYFISTRKVKKTFFHLMQHVAAD